MYCKPRLLIVDDEPAITEIMARLASRMGWDAVQANSADGFLDAVREGGYYAVLTDYNMPEMDGLEVVQHLRWNGFSQAIIVMSSFIPEAIKSRLKELGVQNFLAKPFHVQMLRSELDKALHEEAAPVPA
jgi:DNA-binding response OmpR family regulator